MSADDGRPSSPRAAAGAHDGRDSDLGGDDDGGDAGAPGRHVPWVDDAFEPGREAAARALLAARGADLPSALFWRGAHASHARRAWEAFYARHDDRFFRERHYLA